MALVPSTDPSSSSSTASPADRIAAAYKQLAESASQLNAASDELGRSINSLDLALQRLNLGIKTWVNSGGWEDAEGNFEDHHLGYTKIGSKWGIALSVTSGTRGWEEHTRDEGEWLFNDAPRALRAEAVDKLPELIEALVKAADTTTSNIKAKTDDARQLAKTVNTLAMAKK